MSNHLLMIGLGRPFGAPTGGLDFTTSAHDWRWWDLLVCARLGRALTATFVVAFTDLSDGTGSVDFPSNKLFYRATKTENRCGF